jgi:SLA1 homology domain 1, SHD1
MHRYLHRLGLVLFVSIVSLSLFAADDLRTWSDSTGKYTLEAKFIGIEAGKVVLEKADGSRIQIELSKLKPEDRIEAVKLNGKKMSENPFKNEGENPFKNSTGSPAKKNNKTTEPDPSAPTATNIDWAGAKQLSVFGSEWKTPSIEPVDLKLNWQPRPVTIPSSDFWDKPTGIVASSAAKRVVVVSAMDKPGNKDGATSTVHICDLEKGTILKSISVSGKFTPLALSADGTQVLARQDVFGFNNSSMLELWKLNGSEFTRLQRWDAAQDKNGQGKDVAGATFLNDGKTLLTWLSGGQLVWWNTDGLKPIQTLQLQGNSSPTLSPDQKFLIGKSNNDLVILDATSGDTLSVKPLAPGNHSRFAISPDGKQLAAMNMNKVEVYDMASANVTTTITASGFGNESPLFWSSPTALLGGHPLCYLAPEMNVNAWAYDGADKVAVLGDHVLMVAAGQGNKGVTLVPAKLPDNAALQLIDQAKNDPHFFILKPGATVRIDASAISDTTIQQEAIDALTKKALEMGFTVGSGNLALVASMEKSKDHEVSYRSFGAGFGREKTHTVPGWTYHLKLVADGRTYWSNTGGNHPPHMLNLKRDETIENHLKQYGVPNANFFKFVELPKYVARAQSDQNMGSMSLKRSQITPNGIR